MNFLTARRIACFSWLTLTVAIAHAVMPVANAPVLTRPSAPVAQTNMVLSTQVPQVSPPDLAMISIVPSKATVARMELFSLTVQIKNVSNKPVAHSRIFVKADYYPLSGVFEVPGLLLPGQSASGKVDLKIPTDSMMNTGPEPYPVHVKFTGTVEIVGPNNSAMPDLDPSNDQKTSVAVIVNPG